MKKRNAFIGLVFVLIFSGCEQVETPMQPQSAPPVISQQLTQEPERKSDQKIFYFNKGTPDEGVLSADSQIFKNNYYKYKNILITYEPQERRPNESEKFDVFITENGKKEILFANHEVGLYYYIPTIGVTKDPSIIALGNESGDAGLFGGDSTYINLLNRKKIHFDYGNDISDISQSHHEDIYTNEIFTINKKTTFALANESLFAKCLKSENAQRNGLEINNLLRNGVPVFKLPTPTHVYCSPKKHEIPNPTYQATDARFQFLGLDKNFQKIYLSLWYSQEAPNEKDKSETLLFEIDATSGAVKVMKDDSWKKNNILHERNEQM